MRARAACRNCGASIAAAPADRFCGSCGQTTATHPPSVREFAHEFVAHNVAFEGSLWRTLHALLLRPGFLTTEYFAGRRARYIAPLRLYLTFSLIFFALSMTSGQDMQLGGVVKIDVQKDSPNHAIVLRPGDETGIAMLDRALERVSKMPAEERQRRVASTMKNFLPYVLIALVPVLAAYLMLLYWGRHRLYGEHLVVAFHAQTAVFVFGSVMGLLPDHPVADVLGVVLLTTVGLQGVMALRRVYGGGWTSTVVRALVLYLVYFITASLAIAALTVASLAA